MYKELTPLKALKELKKRYGKNFSIQDDNRVKIIEIALKDYQELLQRPCVLVGRTNGHTKALIDVISRNYKEIKITNIDNEKKVKALEIIKTLPQEEKQILLNTIYSYTKSEEEYELLKEILL